MGKKQKTNGNGGVVATTGKKTECPISRQEFKEQAEPLAATIGGRALTIDTKEFSTGSFGWYANDKMKLRIGEKEVQVQVGINLTIIGSKDLPPAETEEQATE